MTEAIVSFTEEKEGYNKAHVNAYISKLAKAYQTACAENQALEESYKNLQEACKKLEVQERSKLNAEIIAKTMVNMETLAQRIIADAQEEVLAAKTEAKKILAEANAEAEEAKAAALKTLDAANAEAARIVDRAKSSFAQAQDVMQQTERKLTAIFDLEVPVGKSGVAC